VNKHEELQRLEDSSDSVPFDQFEENKKKFGTKSTYDFNKYTTVIDESKITAEVRAKADQVES
jgi:PAB1-binding protein PBP1